MQKAIAYVALKNIAKVRFYVTYCKKTIEQVKKETNADYVMNAGMWNADGSACPLLKVNGKWISKYSWDTWCYAYDVEDKVPSFCYSSATKKVNILATTPLIVDKKPIASLSYGTAQGGKRGRTAIGMTNDSLILYVSKDGTSEARTPEALRDELARLGCKNAMMLDSGSSSMCNFNGEVIKNSSRKCHNWILVYLEKNSFKPVEDKKLSNYKVCIDPGHGVGCVNGSPDGSYKEYEFAYDMANRLRKILEGRNVETVFTRSTTSYPTLSYRASFANSSNSTIFVSIHSNAAGNNGWYDASGFLVYTSMPDENADRNKLAKAIVKKAKENGIKLLNASGIAHEKWTVLVKTKMPAILVEYGFHTSKSDVELLKSNAYREKLAKITADGICDYLGVNYNSNKTNAEKVKEKFGFSDETMNYLSAYKFADDMFKKLLK